MEWSKGVIFLMATFWVDGLWMAELYKETSALVLWIVQLVHDWESHQTTPYAPSPTTSWMSYCSLTLNEILRDEAALLGWLAVLDMTGDDQRELC